MNSKLPSPEMIIDCVDGNNEVVGKVSRKDLFLGSCGFRTAHALLFCNDATVVIHQQSASRERTPLMWGSSVSAYLFSGEDYTEAIVRRAEQELGVRVQNAELLFVQKQNDLGHDKFIGFVVGSCVPTFSLNEAEVNTIELVTLHQLRDMLSREERVFTATFRSLMSEYFEAYPVFSNG